jgi:hypothetical protein
MSRLRDVAGAVMLMFDHWDEHVRDGELLTQLADERKWYYKNVNRGATLLFDNFYKRAFNVMRQRQLKHRSGRSITSDAQGCEIIRCYESLRWSYQKAWQRTNYLAVIGALEGAVGSLYGGALPDSSAHNLKEFIVQMVDKWGTK